MAENKAAKLREEYRRQLAKLQAECPHTHISDWEQHYWALAHASDFMEQSCIECEKVIHTKHWCGKCRKELIDDQAKQAEGKLLPHGPVYCADCVAAAQQKEREATAKAPLVKRWGNYSVMFLLGYTVSTIWLGTRLMLGYESAWLHNTLAGAMIGCLAAFLVAYGKVIANWDPRQRKK